LSRFIEGWDVGVHDLSLRAVAGFFAAELFLCSGSAFAQTSLDANAPIQLHPPTIQLHLPAKKPPPHRHEATPDKLQMGAPSLPRTPAKPISAALPPSPSHAERRRAVEETLVAPAARNDPTGFSFDVAPASPKPAPAKPPAAQKQPSASAPINKARAVAVPRKSMSTASLQSSPTKTAPPLPPEKLAAHANDHAGLMKQGEILFPPADAAPQAGSVDQLKALAAALNTALDSGSGRVELEAYAGPPGDKSSDARRLSLRRALATRQLLIDGGVPANRIDVRALGGIDDHGNSDRVDIFLGGASGG
jgi:outer membrane protein OmpA-like peptidoglycan-associated protein